MEKEEETPTKNQRVVEITTPNLEAYQHFFKGEELLNKLRLAEARQEFEQAIALDSTFGLAYYRLAYVLGWNNETVESEMIQKALALIEHIPEKERYLVRAHQVRLQKDLRLAFKC